MSLNLKGQERIDYLKSSPFLIKQCEGVPAVKDISTGNRIVTGCGNGYYFVDDIGDVLVESPCKVSIKERGPKVTTPYAKIKHALFHDLTLLPGKPIVLEEKEMEYNGMKFKGLYFETKMDNSTTGSDTLVKYLEGVYDNHSIGYQYVNGTYIDNSSKQWKKYVDMMLNPEKAEALGYMYMWKELMLFEYSTVPFGMNKLTPALGVKDGENKDALLFSITDRMQKIENVLRKGKISDECGYDLSLQMLQLKQIIIDLDIKDIGSASDGGEGDQRKKLAKNADHEQNKKGIKFNQLIKKKTR